MGKGSHEEIEDLAKMETEEEEAIPPPVCCPTNILLSVLPPSQQPTFVNKGKSWQIQSKILWHKPCCNFFKLIMISTTGGKHGF